MKRYSKENETKISKMLRYLGGATLWLGDKIVIVAEKLLEYWNLIGIVICIVGMVAAYNAFDNGNINYITSVLFIIVLMLLMGAIIKIMRLEDK